MFSTSAQTLGGPGTELASDWERGLVHQGARLGLQEEFIMICKRGIINLMLTDYLKWVANIF